MSAQRAWGTCPMAKPAAHDLPSEALQTSLTGYQLLADPLLNKGTAFTEAERDAFDLYGLLPPNIGTLEEQVSRRLQVLRGFETDLERYAFLRDLQDMNETLFFALLVQNLEELLPIVYTPTVGAGCQQFSRLFRKPRGLYLSLPHKESISQILAHPRFDKVEARMRENLLDAVLVRQAQVQPARLPEQPAELLAPGAHRRGIDDRQQLLEILD